MLKRLSLLYVAVVLVMCISSRGYAWLAYSELRATESATHYNNAVTTTEDGYSKIDASALTGLIFCTDQVFADNQLVATHQVSSAIVDDVVIFDIPWAQATNVNYVIFHVGAGSQNAAGFTFVTPW